MSLDFRMKPDALYFVALGGCGTFGSNMSLYGYNGKWIMIDCGMGFADNSVPGVELVLPDPEFAVSLGDNLLGILITHGHEDHIGGIRHLWSRFKTPIYATKFNVDRIAQSVSEKPWGNQTMLQEVPQGSALSLGPFDIQLINMAHSTPEASAFVITVKDVGTVLHTGDWKIDPNPVEGEQTDEAALKALGDKGVLAVIGDSSNAPSDGHSGSELKVQENLIKLFDGVKGVIAAACFSTSVARISSVAKAAELHGRSVCLVGRSINNIGRIARENGYLKNIPEFISEEEALSTPPNKLVYLCTGSQGEPRAALTRIAENVHKHIKFGANTTVIFTSRAVPGHEKSVEKVINKLMALGVKVITGKDEFVHVSGHPYRDELKLLYSWVKPKSAILIHGEYMQQESYSKLSAECGISENIIPLCGDVIEISKSGTINIVSKVISGTLAVEGSRIVRLDHGVISMRKRIMYNGSAFVTVVVDGKGYLLAEPRITALGLLDETSEEDLKYVEEAIELVDDLVKNMSKRERSDNEYMRENIRLTVRRFLKAKFDRKPQTRVHLVRV